MRGRKPTPTRLKILNGNPGKRPINGDEPRPDRTKPRCPAHLSPEARKEWDRVSGELHRLGLLSMIDRAALAAYCQSWARWVEAEQKVAATGLLLKAGEKVYVNPYVRVARGALEDLKTFLCEFGMTPCSRTRLSTPGQPDKDPFAEFLSGETEAS